MASSVSAKKRIRQAARQSERNRTLKSAIRTYTKKVLAAVDKGDRSQAVDSLRIATKNLDKAAKTRVLHPNKAARDKSRLARMVAKMS